MSAILHHLAVLGWGWVALFATFVLGAVVCAVLAIKSPRRRVALVLLAVSGGVTLASIVATIAAAAAGLSSASAAVAADAADPSLEAKTLADGISVAMNGAALGLLATLVAGMATVVCLVTVIRRLKSGPAAV
jgi:hypothetical protein